MAQKLERDMIFADLLNIPCIYQQIHSPECYSLLDPVLVDHFPDL